MQPPRTRTLRDLAGAQGFTAESLAQVLEVDKATIYRHWMSHDWVGKISARVLRHLASVLEGVDVAVIESAVAERHSQIVRKYTQSDHPLDVAAIEAATEELGIAPQHMCTALEACLAVLKQDLQRTEVLLLPLWGKKQSVALNVVFGTHGNQSPLPDTNPLVEAAREAFVKAEKRSLTFKRVTAQSHLAHHVGKATGELLPEQITMGLSNGLSGTKRGFYVRASYMGALRHRDNLELAQQYNEYVNKDGIARMLEAWSFPSWSGDIDASNDFSVPRRLMLVNTAEEIMNELLHYNDAYVWYLVNTFVPLALSDIDPSFGGRMGDLRKALAEKAETTETTEIKSSCEKLLMQL
jgi:hypothetical protein